MSSKPIKLDVILEVPVGIEMKQLRGTPVAMGEGVPDAILGIYSSDPSIQPSNPFFHLPKDTLKMILFTQKGEVIWKRDIGPGMVPGHSFCPILAFDLDGDGIDEIWFINNLDPNHIFGISNYVLERVHSHTGRTIGQWKWPEADFDQAQSHVFRNFMAGGYVKGQPVLVTGQGTYNTMYIQGWKQDMTYRWNVTIDKNDPGARGSHVISIADLDQDGVQEILWGERCIELDKGTELFCADRDTYRGHSDIIQPIHDLETGRWYVYTCREKDPDATPRVILYDSKGQRVWGDIEKGHIHMGFTARIGENRQLISTANKLGFKTVSAFGYQNHGMELYAYETLTGKPYHLPFRTESLAPVDINGDGYHELIRTFQCGDGLTEGEVLDHKGNIIGNVGSPICMGSKFMDHPGEQLMSFHPSGKIRIWADRNAEDSKWLIERCNSPLYKVNQKLTAVSSSNIFQVSCL